MPPSQTGLLDAQSDDVLQSTQSPATQYTAVLLCIAPGHCASSSQSSAQSSATQYGAAASQALELPHG
jgi:hypothetical protein